jgi:hypothetical protein
MKTQVRYVLGLGIEISSCYDDCEMPHTKEKSY